MSLFTKEKQTHKLREKTSDCQGVKKGGRRYSQGVWGGQVHTAMFKMDTNKELCIAQGTLLIVMWQPGWEASSGENAYMYVYD